MITLVRALFLTPFQGGNTGSNPVGGARSPVPRLVDRDYDNAARSLLPK
jgi:hypothetical protein